MANINKISVNGTVYDIEDTTARASSGVGLTDDIKTALLNCFEKVAWIDADGQSYYDALESALYPPANLVSISCVYTQSGTVYNTDSLDVLKNDLVVTAHWDDSSTTTVTTYALSGTLEVGTSAITVTYGGKTTTFNVTVTEFVPEYPKTLTDTSDGVGFGSFDVSKPSPTTGIPYVSNLNSSRIHCMGTDSLGYPIKYGYNYTFTVASGAEVDAVACRTFNEDAIPQIQNLEAVTSTNTLNGAWNTFADGEAVFTPAMINGKEPVAMWIVFKKNSAGTGTWSNITDLTPITITETESA